jgi:hypothetical protein
MYGGVFLAGYLLASAYSAWERQRFVESEVASNGVASLLRLGLADELDLLRRDLAAVGPPLDAVQAKPQQADVALGDARQQLAAATRRVGLIKERFGNTPADEDFLRRLILDRYRQLTASEREPPKPSDPRDKNEDRPAAAATPPAAGEAKKP